MEHTMIFDQTHRVYYIYFVLFLCNKPCECIFIAITVGNWQRRLCILFVKTDILTATAVFLLLLFLWFPSLLPLIFFEATLFSLLLAMYYFVSQHQCTEKGEEGIHDLKLTSIRLPSSKLNYSYVIDNSSLRKKERRVLRIVSIRTN